jgi:hypothetical protein
MNYLTSHEELIARANVLMEGIKNKKIKNSHRSRSSIRAGKRCTHFIADGAKPPSLGVGI